MDNNKGNFEEINKKAFDQLMQKKEPQAFQVGEVIEVRGSRLRVHKILKNKIVFKLLKKS